MSRHVGSHPFFAKFFLEHRFYFGIFIGELDHMAAPAGADEESVVMTDDDDVETEIDFEDLSEVIRQALDERLHVLGDLQEVSKSIQQLERTVEAMQISMTTSSSLLSNRLFHHQQLPLERAHPGQAPAMLQDTLPLKRIQPTDEQKDEP